VILSHKTCGHVLQPHAICRACKREVSAADIQIDLGTIAETVREDAGQVRVSRTAEGPVCAQKRSFGNWIAFVCLLIVYRLTAFAAKPYFAL
jgi:hypothetical protein